MSQTRLPDSVLLREDRPADRPSRLPLIPSGPMADLSAVCLVAIASALVVWAYRIAPTTRSQSYYLIFWAGMLLAYLAVAWRVVSGRYAVLWLGLLGLFTMLTRFAVTPGGPIGFD